MKTTTRLFAFSMLLCYSSSAFAVLVGPTGTAPGGNSWVNTGGVSGTEALATWDYSGFNPGSFSALYFGLNQVDYGPLAATINGGSLNPLSYVGSSGTTATWSVSAPYTSAGGTGDPPSGNYPITFTMTVSGLGPSPWIDATSLGLSADIGAVADNSAGADFTLHWQVLVDMGSYGIVPLNGPGGVPGSNHTGFSFADGFYSTAAVPEPSSFLCVGLVGLGLIGWKKLKQNRESN
ncbi:PEP-CTERM sorting domain-containing protein [Bythopirellula polymerisocia]|uniref:Ice-binding protein C-terminal domain-containing protein n=1 Tax=Bythopirellula polymerisocia TaxID=2528003 RepID=A0A5C6CQT1_9BACT|nr:PEP-CTERM sorting domain-containing protein [Bythopirellula polymerisocia]TWU25821.1 hypothetical protein Pla144_30330 [Bythopirellula polymerisocia]